MIFSTLISIDELAHYIEDSGWALVDCRFNLADAAGGRESYRIAHIPGAVYAHLNEDLSSPVIKGKTGRHPLPDPEILAAVLGAWGIDDSTQVVAYDDAAGSMAAARLWWMLRWLGHEAVAVLDGGWGGWLAAKMPVNTGEESRMARRFVPRIKKELSIEAEELVHSPLHQDIPIIDVRARERYRGEIEPIDPIAGHIPGAINAPYDENTDPEGFFYSPEILKQKYRSLLGDVPVPAAVFYCGSGVTAPQSLLALVHAGLGEGRLYPGSWSEWITDPNRTIETGGEKRP